jgi:hypothetical protein
MPDMAWHSRPELQPDFLPPGMARYLAAQSAPAASSLALLNRIAFVGAGDLSSNLAEFACVQQLHPGAPDNLHDEPAQILLIGGDWPQAGDPWRQALLNVSEPAVAVLRDLILRYRARGIPSALRITGEADTTAAFSHLHELVDAVFAPEVSCIPNGHAMDPGVNVKLYNPIRENVERHSEDSPYFQFLIDGAFELSQFLARNSDLDLLHPFTRFNSWLIDSSYRYYQSANVKVHPVLRRRFLGCPAPAAKAFLVKLSLAMFLPSVLQARRPVQFRTLARQAAACKTLTISDADVTANDGILHCNGSDDLNTLLSWMMADEIARAGAAHYAWRDSLSRHTIFERLETILGVLGVPCVYSAPPKPAVNIVMSTVRPQLIPHVLNMYRRQTYENTNLTIVANGVTVPREVARDAESTSGARLCFVPGDKTLGYCMNFGIDQAPSDYWAKWDDDDVYGPHYLGDLLLQRKYVDFDITGKAAIFNYIEEHDCTYLRNFETRDTPIEQVGGGTLLVRNEERHFAEGGRGGEDRAFLHLARERGDRIVAADPFNFVQIRRIDRASHTWALGAHAIDLSGPKRQGLSLESIVL